MAKKKEMDNLSLDMIRCKADGFGCHYGHWKLIAGNTKPIEVEMIPNDWRTCEHCGKQFKPRVKKQKYCEAACQHEAQMEKTKAKRHEYMRNYIANKRAERTETNESYT